MPLIRPSFLCVDFDKMPGYNTHIISHLCLNQIREVKLLSTIQYYSKHIFLTDVFKKTSEHHQQSAKTFPSGLEFDDMEITEFIDLNGRKKVFNIGLIYPQEAYFWTIMLLTRLLLIEHVSKHISSVATSANLDETRSFNAPLDTDSAHACVDSVIRRVE